MKKWLVAIALLIMQKGLAQINLVPNPSFENTANCPYNTGQINLAYPWFSATNASPDLFNVCSTVLDVQVPINWAGHQIPNSGAAYAGICVYSIDEFREYIEVKLTNSLVKNNVYCVELFVSISDTQNFSANNIGVLFAVDSSFYATTENINSNTTLRDNQVYTDQNEWFKVDFYYIAQGDEEYIIIGNFFKNSSTKTSILNSPYTLEAYYYIDDISVMECTIPDVEAINIPNIFSPNSDGINETFAIDFLPPNSKLAIYSRWGTEVYTSTNYNNNWDGENLSEGVYYYVLTLPSGNSTKGTVTIIR